MKTAIFIPALPSPAFLTSRLDAVRPMLQVGSTRVLPSVPGVTFGDDPAARPADLMTNPPLDPPPPPPVADVGIAPPPDGVYPVPPAASLTFDAQIPINPSGPERPTYSPRRPPSGGTGSGSQPPQSTGPTSTSTGGTGSTGTPTRTTAGHPPVEPPPSKPVSRPTGEPTQPKPVSPPKVIPPVTVPKTDDTSKKFAASVSEQEMYRLVLQDIDPKQPNFTKALSDLDAWSHKYPASSSSNDRLYYYVHVYNGMSRSEQVLDTAAPVVQAGVRTSYKDQQQVLQILVAASASLPKIRKTTPEQLATGQKAARELLEFLPEYFSPHRKPSNVSDAEWSLMRGQLEEVARQALAHRPVKQVAAN
jgi:hypothetical protein